MGRLLLILLIAAIILVALGLWLGRRRFRSHGIEDETEQPPIRPSQRYIVDEPHDDNPYHKAVVHPDRRHNSDRRSGRGRRHHPHPESRERRQKQRRHDPKTRLDNRDP